MNNKQKINSVPSASTNDDSSNKVESEIRLPNLHKTNVVRSACVKAWIVRCSAFSIQCGGLQRLFIHFAKPTFFYEKLTEKDRDMPIGDISIQEGLFKRAGWYSYHKTWVNCLSVGNWLGYENSISNFIWDELCKHFLNAPFDTWHILEKEGKCKIEDFCLEINLSMSLS